MNLPDPWDTAVFERLGRAMRVRVRVRVRMHDLLLIQSQQLSYFSLSILIANGDASVSSVYFPH